MKLGIGIGYSGGQLALPMERILLAEKLGYDSLWTAEAYGSDALTPLAYIAALTKHIRLGTGIIQLAARTPAATAMAVQTLDALAGGNRVICGLGVSGPQIVEGWYGQPWGRPYYRIRDYVQIMKKIFARDEPVSHDGAEISLPYTGPGAMGIGKPLKSILHTNPDLPIWLGTGTESNVRLTAQYADGWLPLGFTPGAMDTYRPWLEEGFKRAGNGKSLKDFEIQTGVSVIITKDVREAFRKMKPGIALYVGGWSAAATAKRPGPSRSSTSPGARPKRSKPSPTNTATKAASSAPPTASANATPPGPTAAPPASPSTATTKPSASWPPSPAPAPGSRR